LALYLKQMEEDPKVGLDSCIDVLEDLKDKLRAGATVKLCSLAAIQVKKMITDAFGRTIPPVEMKCILQTAAKVKRLSGDGSIDTFVSDLKARFATQQLHLNLGTVVAHLAKFNKYIEHTEADNREEFLFTEEEYTDLKDMPWPGKEGDDIVSALTSGGTYLFMLGDADDVDKSFDCLLRFARLLADIVGKNNEADPIQAKGAKLQLAKMTGLFGLAAAGVTLMSSVAEVQKDATEDNLKALVRDLSQYKTESALYNKISSCPQLPSRIPAEAFKSDEAATLHADSCASKAKDIYKSMEAVLASLEQIAGGAADCKTWDADLEEKANIDDVIKLANSTCRQASSKALDEKMTQMIKVGLVFCLCFVVLLQTFPQAGCFSKVQETGAES
jgi:hypothetical protein